MYGLPVLADIRNAAQSLDEGSKTVVGGWIHERDNRRLPALTDRFQVLGRVRDGYRFE